MIENSVILINRPDDQPTHLFCAWKTLSIPDLSISSKDIQRICDREACTQLGGSDHLPVLLKVILTEQTTSQKKEPSWNYKKADWSKFENPTDVLCRKLDTDRLGKRVVGNDQQNRDRSHLLLSVSKERGVYLTDQRTRNPSARHPNVPRKLGMKLDRKLTWFPHVSTMHSKALGKMSLMKKLVGTKWGANMKILTQVYTATVRPHMEYASNAWSSAGRTKLDQLTKAQNAGLRIITGGTKTTPISEVERTACLLS